MGFDDVYRSLQELFPLIDRRALRAVAIDHSKDVDTAVLAVLEEIIPRFERSTPTSSSSSSSTHLSSRCICDARSEASTSGAVVRTQTEDGPQNDPCCYAYDNTAVMTRMSAAVQSCGGPVECVDVNEVDTLPIKITSPGGQFSDDTIDVQDLDAGVGQIVNLTQEEESVAGQLEIDRVNKESDVLVGPSESSASLNEPAMSESSEVRIVDLVEAGIQEARDNKKTLSTAIESVISLMQQVGLKEQAVEQAKVEAGIGGKNTLDKVEELKRMLHYAKEANDMRVGEVYGEKAILVTELRELQARVLSMSDDRDKSLFVLDEIRLTLEVRLDAAENAIRSAEHEKLNKENAALKLLADQELVMEKVVQESKILQQQAEENTKLEEFLVDRGRVVDMLQGELAAICQDVRVLKKKFDEHVPLSESPFASQSSYILTTSSFDSSPSLKSPNMEQVGPLPV